MPPELARRAKAWRVGVNVRAFGLLEDPNPDPPPFRGRESGISYGASVPFRIGLFGDEIHILTSWVDAVPL